MAKQKIYGNRSEPCCETCALGKRAPDGNTVLCRRGGALPLHHRCRHFVYDPLRRTPRRDPVIEPFDEAAFSLDAITEAEVRAEIHPHKTKAELAALDRLRTYLETNDDPNVDAILALLDAPKPTTSSDVTITEEDFEEMLPAATSAPAAAVTPVVTDATAEKEPVDATAEKEPVKAAPEESVITLSSAELPKEESLPSVAAPAEPLIATPVEPPVVTPVTATAEPLVTAPVVPPVVSSPAPPVVTMPSVADNEPGISKDLERLDLDALDRSVNAPLSIAFFEDDEALTVDDLEHHIDATASILLPPSESEETAPFEVMTPVFLSPKELNDDDLPSVNNDFHILPKE